MTLEQELLLFKSVLLLMRDKLGLNIQERDLSRLKEEVEEELKHLEVRVEENWMS